MTLKTKSKQDSITIEDIIQELAYQNSIKGNYLNDKERRKKILNNYFKGNDIKSKFPSKYKMESAIKRINKEMENSADKFSELFHYEFNK